MAKAMWLAVMLGAVASVASASEERIAYVPMPPKLESSELDPDNNMELRNEILYERYTQLDSQFVLCAKNESDLEYHIMKLLAYENTPYAIETRIAIDRLEGKQGMPLPTRSVKTVEQTDYQYNIILENAATHGLLRRILYKCAFFQAVQLEDEANGFYWGGVTELQNYHGIIAKSTLDPRTAKEQALEFVKSGERLSADGLYNVIIRQTPREVTVSFRTVSWVWYAETKSMENNYYQMKYTFNMSDHTVFKDQEIYHTDRKRDAEGKHVPEPDVNILMQEKI